MTSHHTPTAVRHLRSWYFWLSCLAVVAGGLFIVALAARNELETALAHMRAFQHVALAATCAASLNLLLARATHDAAWRHRFAVLTLADLALMGGSTLCL